MGDGMNSALGIAAAPDPNPVSQSNLLADKAVRRYTDGYRVANFIKGVGTFIKVCGFIVGGLIFLVGLNNADTFGRRTSDTAVLAALFTAGITCIAFFVAGVMVSAQGQQLMASLDSAVHSSPFLDNDAKAKAMSLLSSPSQASSWRD